MERLVTIIAIILVGVVGANFVVQLLTDSGTVGRQEMTREEVETDLLARPMAEVYAEIANAFPEEYEEHIDAVQEVVNARRLSVDEVGKKVGEESQAFLDALHRNNVFFIGQAPDAEIIALQRASLALLESASGDAALCAAIAKEGATGFDRYERAKLDPDLLQALTLANFRAMAAGRDRPNPKGAPDDADWRAFINEMAGLPEDLRTDVRAFLEGESEDERAYCDGAIAFQRQLAESDTPAARRILADMIAFTSVR